MNRFRRDVDTDTINSKSSNQSRGLTRQWLIHVQLSHAVSSESMDIMHVLKCWDGTPKTAREWNLEGRFPLHSGICGRAVASQKSFDFLYGNDSVWFSNEDCTVFLNDIQRNVHIRYIYILPMEFLLSNPDNDLLVTSWAHNRPRYIYTVYDVPYTKREAYLLLHVY